MKKMKKSIVAFLSLALCMITLFAVPVSAEVDDTIRAGLEMSVPQYIQSVFSATESDIAQMKESGGVAEIIATALEENQETLGEFTAFNSMDIDDSSDSQLVVSSDVTFANYDAEIVMYLSADAQTITNFVVNIDYPFAEKMAQAGQNTVIGIAIVIVMLIFLSLVISLFRFIPNGEKKAKKNAPAAKPAAAPAPAAAKPAAPAVAQTSDDEIVAVIAAAIAAAESDMPSESGYVVRSIKRAGSARSWKRG